MGLTGEGDVRCPHCEHSLSADELDALDLEAALARARKTVASPEGHSRRLVGASERLLDATERLAAFERGEVPRSGFWAKGRKQ